MATVGEAKRLGISPFAETVAVELRAVRSSADVQAVIWAAYRQVLGNEHICRVNG